MACPEVSPRDAGTPTLGCMSSYADYAAAFTAAVHQAADEVLALSLPVTVTVVHDPRTPHADADGDEAISGHPVS